LPLRDVLAGPRQKSVENWVQRLLRMSSDTTALALAIVLGAVGAWIASRILRDGSFDILAALSSQARLTEFAVLSILLIVLFGSRGHYSSRHPFWTETRDVVVGVLVFAMADSSLQFAFQDQTSRLWLGITWVLTIPLIMSGRLFTRYLLNRSGRWSVRTLMIGEGRYAENATTALESEPYLGYNVVARCPFAALDPDSQPLDGSDNILEKVGGSVGHAVSNLVADCRASFVVLSPSPQEFGQLDQIVSRLDRWNIPYAVVPPLKGISMLSLEPQQFYSHDVMMLTFRASLTHPAARIMKRLFDLVVSMTLLTVLAPFLLTVAFVIKLDGGPALFGQTRVGKEGRLFTCLKFRSMVPDADVRLKQLLESDAPAAAEWAETHKLRDDPRITLIGSFLRRTSLDELPQLFNVLRGEMSLVGPRPIVEEEVARYGDDLDYYLNSLPGITGLWQVSGRNDTSYQRRVELDRWYTQNWSLWQDIAILCKTIPAVTGRKGAY